MTNPDHIVHRISKFGTVALLINNVVGPGMPSIPHVFQAAGWLPSITVVCIMCMVSVYASMCLCEAMQRLPGNRNYERNIEFLGVVKAYLSHRQYLMVVVCMVLSLQAVLIASIIQSIQVADDVVEKIFGKSCGVMFHPEFTTICAKDLDLLSDAVIFTAGFVVFAVIVVPVGFFELDDSIFIQKGCFVLLLLIIAEWAGHFSSMPPSLTAVPVVGSDLHQVLGVLAFNYCFVSFVPAWVNKKSADVQELAYVTSSTVFGSIVFAVIGLWAALVLPISAERDILDVMNDQPSFMAVFSVFAFPICVNISGIPVLSIVIRDNLMQERLCSERWALFWANIFPWALTMPFYTGAGFQNLVNWTSLMFMGLLNFIVPLWVYLKATGPSPRARGGGRGKGDEEAAWGGGVGAGGGGGGGGGSVPESPERNRHRSPNMSPLASNAIGGVMVKQRGEGAAHTKDPHQPPAASPEELRAAAADGDGGSGHVPQPTLLPYGLDLRRSRVVARWMLAGFSVMMVFFIFLSFYFVVQGRPFFEETFVSARVKSHHSLTNKHNNKLHADYFKQNMGIAMQLMKNSTVAAADGEYWTPAA